MDKQSNLSQEIQDCFKRYAGSVILDRAICDVRDLLKPSARMLLYSQYKNRNTFDKPFMKSARVVGDCLGHFYSHGDSSCYGTYMRMAKPFALRYPLEECQGNYGTLVETGDEAHMRYTEIRLSKTAGIIFDNLDKNCIDKWLPNFDETEFFPSVLPSIGFYNIVNGTTGIGVSISSSIPQFNLREVNEAIIKLIENPECKNEDIICMPDFATGGTIINKQEVYDSLICGSGKSCCIRAKIKYNEKTNTFCVYELPYGVYTNTIKEEIAALVNEDSNYGIESINDASSDVCNFEIKLSKNANPEQMLAKLYRDTSLENFFGINMTMLDEGRFPKVFGWREALQAYITHIYKCQEKILSFDKSKLESRNHIIDGLLIAAANIDEVVALIRASNSTADAKNALITRYAIDEDQAKAILSIKLASLAKLEYLKLDSEKKENDMEIMHLRDILLDTKKLNGLLIDSLRAVANKFGDARRTEIKEIKKEENIFVAKPIMLYTLPNNKFIISKIAPKNHIASYSVMNDDNLLLITSLGKIYPIKLLDVPAEKEQSFETFTHGETIVKILTPSALNNNKYLIFSTKNGYVKKSASEDYSLRAKAGTAALKLKEDDELVSCESVNEEQRIMLCSNTGHYNYYDTSLIPLTGKATFGVKGISLRENEDVVASIIIDISHEYIGLFSISTDMYGKITPLADFSETSRAVRGNSFQRMSVETNIEMVKLFEENDTIIYKNKKLINVPIMERVSCGTLL